MKKRHSISVRGQTYKRLALASAATGRSMSGLLEDAITEDMDRLGVPVPARADARPARPRALKRLRVVHAIDPRGRGIAFF